jgi:tRNA dimethylallyltransferase
MKPIIFIVGPTASGKSETAFFLARKLQAEIISGDSMLVYKEPAVITAAPKKAMLKAVKHHFVGIISVRRKYSVFDYYTKAVKLIKELSKKNVPLIVCGGSGLYIKALCDGIFEGAVSDKDIRAELNERAEKEGLEILHRELLAVDKEAAGKISQNDKRRIIRALEVYHASGEPISGKQKQAKGICGEFNTRIFGLRLARERLYQQINLRCQKMFQEGGIDEVKILQEEKLSLTASKIIGLKEIAAFLRGAISRQEALSLMQKNTRNFAKRQMTWFNKDKRVEWIDVDTMKPPTIADEIFKRINHRP